MIDLVKLTLLAGDGGHGRISLHREKCRPKGGPDGGHGGNGGSVIVVGDKNINTLKHYAGAKEFKAEDGQIAGNNKKTGASAEDVILKVPLGTVVWLTGENKTSSHRRRKYAKPDWSHLEQKSESLLGSQEKSEEQTPGSQTKQKKEQDECRYRMNALLTNEQVKYKKYRFEQERERIPHREEDELESLNLDEVETTDQIREFFAQDKITNIHDSNSENLRGIKLAEITEHNQQIAVCQGGFGGRGNNSFKSSINRTPLEAEYGTFGEKKEVVLELRLLADVGLVGFPNAGKSTLLSKVTKATPKIADYPFTTLEPNLGVLNDERSGKDLIVADIPGLIEGASKGRGLGDRFLRHLENCKTLVFVLFLPEEVVFDDSLTNEQKAEQVFAQFKQLSQELEARHEELLSKSNLLTLNKTDIYTDELIDIVVNLFTKNGSKIFPFSAFTGDGLADVKREVFLLANN
ncbi:MAG: GTPase [Patescibacteria group bacterium]|nr:GTPase [Patescibacteria group bacterium]